MVRARNGHGGPRQGAPGKSYQNRSDMTQAPRAVPGQTYGDAGQQIAAQQAVPLPQQAPPPAAGQGSPGVPGGPSGAPLTPIGAPTQRPGEPLTTGIPTGPGAGPEALGPMPGQTSPVDEVRALFAAYPTDDMRRLVAYLDGQ
jgi:hypothetical protein